MDYRQPQIGPVIVADGDVVLFVTGSTGEYDHSASRNNGSFPTGVSQVVTPTGECFSFDGVDQVLAVPHSDSINFTNSDPFSVVFSVIPRAQETSVIFAKVNSDPNGWQLGFNWDDARAGVLCFRAGFCGTTFPDDCALKYDNSTASLTLGREYLVAMTYSGSGTGAGIKLYVDGVEPSYGYSAGGAGTAFTGGIESTEDFLIAGRGQTGATRAQADYNFLSIIERELTAAEVRALVNNRRSLVKPQRRVLYAPAAAGGQTISVAQTTETSLAQTITAALGALVVSLGLVTETCLAQTITPIMANSVAVSQVTETDTAQSITPSLGALMVAAAQATETDLAQAITANQGAIIAAGQASETDLAQTVTPVLGALSIAVGQTTETDAAQAVTPQQGNVIAVGQAAETDLAQSVSVGLGAVTVAVGQVSETDLAQAITVSGGTVYTIADIAFTLAKRTATFTQTRREAAFTLADRTATFTRDF